MSSFFFSRMTCALLGFVVLGTLTSTATGADPVVRKVTVVGTSTLHVVPDEMNWAVQISVNDSTLAKAKARHDASLTAALAYLKGLGDAIKDLQTGGIRFERNLYPGDNSFARANPYTCSTQITFTLLDFDKYGPLADAISKFEGAQVQSVDYATSKEADTRRIAAKQALLDAHDKASDLAVTAGCYIDKPLEITEGSIDTGPRPLMLMARVASIGTPPAVPGQLEVSASVTATYDLYYK